MSGICRTMCIWRRRELLRYDAWGSGLWIYVSWDYLCGRGDSGRG